MKNYKLNHVQRLETESIHIFREVAAQFEKPVLLFSGGKDSLTMAHLAQKAFWPGSIPFPFLHVDTGHNFEETIEFRDDLMDRLGVELIVAKVQDMIDDGSIREEKSTNNSRNRMQIPTLLKALEDHDFDAAFGGARRDEEKARAKERFFSHRDEFGQWDPKNQRPELWNLYNGRKNNGEHFRVFPLSNWTEMDIWQYIAAEELDIPSLYLAHQRDVVNRDGIYLAKNKFLSLKDGEEYEEKSIRFRTIGDMTCTGAVLSAADSLPKIIEEVASARITERGNRADDKNSEAAMEERKKQGYF
jgi:sulfate adenylyltransferase subunit 2